MVVESSLQYKQAISIQMCTQAKQPSSRFEGHENADFTAEAETDKFMLCLRRESKQLSDLPPVLRTL